MRSCGKPRIAWFSFDPHHREFLVILDRRFRVHHVPVLGNRRIVKLQDQSGIDDGLVFLAHGLADRVHELFVALVVDVAQPRCARRRNRGHEAFFDAVGFQCRFEMADVGLDRVVALIDDRSGADRPLGHWRPGINAAVRILIDRQKLGAVAPVGKACQHDFARLGTLRRRVVKARASKVEPAKSIEAIAPPGPVIDLVAHRFAEFAVARNVDPDVFLLTDNVDDGFLQRLLKGTIVARLVRFASGIGGDQIVRPRQAARLAGENVVAAHAHGRVSNDEQA